MGNAFAVRFGRRSASNARPKGAWSIQLCRWLGMAFVVAGFAGIGMGWNEMARVTCVDCQLPYLLSAGAGGLGAIVLGVGMLVIAQIRAERMRLFRRLEAAGSVLAAPSGEIGSEDRRDDASGRAEAVAGSLRGSGGR